MTTKILKTVLNSPVRPVPTVPTSVSTPVPLVTSIFNTTPSFQTRAELIANLALGVVYETGVPPSKTSQVVRVANAFGVPTANVEVLEGEITQVL